EGVGAGEAQSAGEARGADEAEGVADANGATASEAEWATGSDGMASAPRTDAPGGGVAGDGAALDEAVASDAASAAARAPAVEVGLGVEAVLDPATLGSAALGGSLALELRRGRLAGGLYAALLPSVSTSLGVDQSIEIGLWTSGARGCWRWGEAFDTCALFELGQVSASGVGLERSSEGRDLWAAPGLGLGWSATPFAGIAITTRLSAFHPLVRGRFRVDESEVVHRIPFVGFRAAVGVELPLL
ncbi:MAG TPA: hypothetical protein VMG12_15315, partial [Polyangiaceae bacterium]|nr:hypothetical protein [Polyangiaceae bacterium]